MLKIFGHSDDLVEFEGQMNDEFDCYDGLKISFIDGTQVLISYGKGNLGIWKIEVLSIGDKFDRLEECFDEDAEIYSDILYMKYSDECLIKAIEEV